MRVEVPSRSGAYIVEVREGALDDPAALAPPPSTAQRVALVADATTEGLYGHLAARSYGKLAEVHPFVLPPGEGSKQATTLEALWRFLATNELHRGDALVALGGGVVTDVAGFAAATYNRGIPWIAAPTTLLGMVDAAIGGKTAIDLPEGKNLAGSFHAPTHVLIDPLALQSLPVPELRTGLAEVIKHALIAEGPLLEMLRSGPDAILARDPRALASLVPEAAKVKIDVVSEDETERGRRAHLNYGHTLAHAIETVEGFQGRTHGEAVAIGLRFVARLAASLGFPDLIEVHDELLAAYGLIDDRSLPAADAILEAMRRDKKYDQGLVFVVLEQLGRPTTVRVDEADVRKTLEALR